MKFGIYYFSGSGNTKWVSEQMSFILSELGHDVDVQSIETVSVPRENDFVILGGPIYAGNVPEKLIRWVLRNMPPSQNSKAAVFTTSAGLEKANGIHSLGRKLINKGYKISGVFTYVLPRNYYFEKYPAAAEEEAKEMFKHVHQCLREDIQQILSNNSEIAVKEKVLSMDLFAELMSIMTRFMGRSFSVNDQCISCGKCAKNCPTRNIVMKKKPVYQNKCMMCTRCIHNCPVHAIEYKKQSFPQYAVKNYI